MKVIKFLTIFLIISITKSQNDEDPKTLQELGIQLKSIIAHLNSTNFSELVRQLRPKSEACIKTLLNGNIKVTQDDVDSVVDYINATIAALPKDNGIFQRAYKIPEHLKSHLMVLVTNKYQDDNNDRNLKF
ncbi:hypothetical protein PVAND_017463 [Polypedilum vanderplanki]|uniref:Uncharacterized protein n=1 Tax=Polypedilum vanderplanki TaxID=319348 RepID=A0A9J6BIR3_POLVA|nr:hypothetical protein PVAND_017463 [Polypedilum vanderplanki]